MVVAVRTDLRNIAVVAHVDHGKTTLVDAMLKQTGAFSKHGQLDERALDSGDLEREKGITILAKNTAVTYSGPLSSEQDITINVIDTPGHSDFGGEVERGLSMVDGVLLLVDASEGPLPQTRFVLSKALASGLPIILVINKTDRGDSRISGVLQDTQDLILSLAAHLADTNPGFDVDSLLDFPVIYASGRAGAASIRPPADGSLPDNTDLEPLFSAIISHIPAPKYDDEHPLQAQVTNLDASPFLGRLALLRIHHGTVSKGQLVSWVRHSGAIKKVKITELLKTQALERHTAKDAKAGDIVAVAGIDEITIGETIADTEDVRPLPAIIVDEPAISMLIGTNTSPLVGTVKGHKLTARMVRERLESELVGNVSIKIKDVGRPDSWEVQGRGELALAILVESMRREGFELTAGKPQVVTKSVNGELLEPFEDLSVDAPEEFVGVVSQLLAGRKGRMEHVSNHGSGWVRMRFSVPSRGLIGFRSEFLSSTRGQGVAHATAGELGKWSGPLQGRKSGSVVADRPGAVTASAMMNLQDRMTFFVQPGDLVYCGMVVGFHSRSEDIDVNITKEKKLNNIRSSNAEELERLVPSQRLSLEECLEFASDDECVEVTPEQNRVRKVELDPSVRARAASTRKRQSVS